MPRQVDHQERRRELIEALWRITAARGLSAVSFRQVAAEAGVSVRQVQYYFGTKSQLLADALQLLGERIVGRGMEGIGAAGPDPTANAIFRAVMMGAQPIDEESRTYLLLFFAFHIASLTDPTLTAELDLADAQRLIVQSFASIIRNAQERGEVADGVDPELEGMLVLATNTGLALGVLSGICTADQAIAAIDYRLNQTFPKKTASGS